jgi:hypothetical protein
MALLPRTAGQPVSRAAPKEQRGRFHTDDFVKDANIKIANLLKIQKND